MRPPVPCKVIAIGILLLSAGLSSAQGLVDSLQYPLRHGPDSRPPTLVLSRTASPMMYATLVVDPDVAAIWRRSPKVTSFFCRTELLIERKSILAPRFRLGSLDYTEWMEGKRGGLTPR